MKTAERIVIVLLLIAIFGGGAWLYFALKYEHQQVLEGVARGDYEQPLVDTTIEPVVDEDDWEMIYPNTVPITIADVPVQASIADSIAERNEGLSNTPFLPENVVKLFVFEVAGRHSIWMKDMNYALDILWLAEDGTIVHMEENITPDTFPSSFSSPIENSYFVVETNAGFVATHGVSVGDDVVLE